MIDLAKNFDKPETMNKTLEKPNRVKDRELLDLYQGRECLICRQTKTTVGHHLKTKKRGGPDALENLMPLCYEHHDEIHRSGLAPFVERYKRAKAWIEFWGWSQVGDKWIPPFKL